MRWNPCLTLTSPLQKVTPCALVDLLCASSVSLLYLVVPSHPVRLFGFEGLVVLSVEPTNSQCGTFGMRSENQQPMPFLVVSDFLGAISRESGNEPGFLKGNQQLDGSPRGHSVSHSLILGTEIAQGPDPDMVDEALPKLQRIGSEWSESHTVHTVDGRNPAQFKNSGKPLFVGIYRRIIIPEGS